MARVPKSEARALPGLAETEKPVTESPKSGEDRELVRQAKNGDREAFESLVRRHQGRVFAVAGGILRNR